ncbi:DUF6114 domain-containing protein [Actinoplanes solisilvae]|uniref:DUF6114 domain-containing protein n=1 Tax=Actinoplanes solisilvae TaxID=2486853 RepID=UPI0013E39031|nr:DUF6114 domain-containing protein [Actinoplanes solisilvae]
MAQDSFRSEFRRWRRKRPFWGGFFLVLAAVELLYSANMNLGNLEVHLGPQGFLSYLLPLLLLLCGLLSWFTPAQRIFYGIIALLTALYTFVGLNLGGFFLGMLFGIIGGALVIAWGPPRIKQAPSPAAEDKDDDPSSAATPERETVEIAGHGDRPARDSDTAFIPGLGTTAPRPAGPGPAEEPPAPREGLHKNPRALTAALLLVIVTGSLLVAGSGRPASAVDCPEGLPSRSSVTSSAPASVPASSPETPAGEDAEPTLKPPVGDPTGAKPPAGPTSSASASAGAGDGAGSEEGAGDGDVLDGIGDLIDGVGNLLGIGDESPSPSTSPSPSATSAPASPTSAPPGSGPAAPSATSPSAASSSSSSKPASSAASASPSAEEIPCLGPRVMGKVADPDGIPRVADKPGLMQVDSLTMYNSTYHGVVDMPTAKGSYKALKFSMDKAVNKPFTLTIDEPGDAWTIIKSNELVTDGRVRFYTSEMKGKLFGVIPVTFTPDKPPPLTLPVLWFTDVTIKLSFVRCDTLTADPLNIRETYGSTP